MEQLALTKAKPPNALTPVEGHLQKRLSDADGLALTVLLDKMLRRYPNQDMSKALPEYMEDFELLAQKYSLRRVEAAVRMLRISPNQKFFPSPNEVAAEIEDQLEEERREQAEERERDHKTRQRERETERRIKEFEDLRMKKEFEDFRKSVRYSGLDLHAVTCKFAEFEGDLISERREKKRYAEDKLRFEKQAEQKAAREAERAIIAATNAKLA
jgi:hypothetical protein